jgi:hypothetical protein
MKFLERLCLRLGWHFPRKPVPIDKTIDRLERRYGELERRQRVLIEEYSAIRGHREPRT